MNNDDQTDSSPEGTKLDEAVTRIIRAWSQASSRRGFLARVSKITFAAATGTVMGALPVDRRVAEAFENKNCNDWRWCAMSGRPCAACGGSNNACPGPTGTCSYNQYWQACCDSGPQCGKTIRYYDCCGSCNQTCGTPGSTQCNKGGSRSGPWCNGYTDALYKCTLAVEVGNCPCR